MGSCSDKIDFSVFLCFCLKFSAFLLSILEVVIFIVDIVRSWQLLCTSLVIRDLKIEVWSCYCKQQTAVGVNGFTLPFYPYLGLTPILAEKLSSKLRFLKQISIINKQKSSKRLYFFSNVGLLFQGAKKTLWYITYLWSVVQPCKREPQTANLTAKPQSGDFLTFVVREKCGKTSVLR